MTDDSAPARPETRPGRWGARIAAAVLLLGAAVVLFDAVRIASDSGAGPQQSGFVPMIVGIGLVLLGLVFLVRTTLWPDESMLARATDEHRNTHWRTLWVVIVGLVIYALLVDPLGYILATTLFLAATVWVVGRRTVVRDVVVAALFSTAVYFAFTGLLGVRLPAGLGLGD